MHAPAMHGVTLSPVGVEALDNPAADPALVRRMLRDIARSNRWLGGTGAARYGMRALLDPSDRGSSLTLLDIGTGAGDLPLDLQRWAARRGVALDPIGIERIPAAGALARANGVPTLLACAGALPVRPQSVDIILMSQLVHHLDAASVIALVRATSRIARRGVIICDLENVPLAGLSFRVGGTLLGLHRVTIDDGITSLRRSYSPRALGLLLREAGITHASIARRPIARVVASWRTSQ